MKIVHSILAVAFLATSPFIHSDAAFADSKGCPPGLAKKDTPCVPPGQAKKGVTTEEWRNGDRIGDVIRSDDLIFLDDNRRYDLPLLRNGHRYAVVNDRIVVINAQNYEILQLIRAFTDN